MKNKSNLTVETGIMVMLISLFWIMAGCGSTTVIPCDESDQPILPPSINENDQEILEKDGYKFVDIKGDYQCIGVCEVEEGCSYDFFIVSQDFYEITFNDYSDFDVMEGVVDEQGKFEILNETSECWGEVDGELMKIQCILNEIECHEILMKKVN